MNLIEENCRYCQFSGQKKQTNKRVQFDRKIHFFKMSTETLTVRLAVAPVALKSKAAITMSKQRHDNLRSLRFST